MLFAIILNLLEYLASSNWVDLLVETVHILICSVVVSPSDSLIFHLHVDGK